MVLQLAALALKLPLVQRHWSSACRRWACPRWAWSAAASPLAWRCGRRCWPPICAVARATSSTPISSCFGRGLDRPDGAALRHFCCKLGVPMGAGDPGGGDRLCLHGDLHCAAGHHAGGRPPIGGQPGVAAVHAAAGPGQCHQHPGRAAHRRGRPGRRAPAGLARPGDRLRPGHAGGWRGVRGARLPVLGLYTSNAAVIAAAMPLVAWVAVFHVADAAQTVAAFVLRAYKVATVPVVIYVTALYVAALWGVGAGGAGLLDGFDGRPGAGRGGAQCGDAAVDAAPTPRCIWLRYCASVEGKGLQSCRPAPSGDAHAQYSFNPRRGRRWPWPPCSPHAAAARKTAAIPPAPTTAVRKPSRAAATAPAVVPAVAARPLSAATPCPPAPRPPAC
jgi:hypothetical protein